MKKLDDKDLKKVDGGSTRIILLSKSKANTKPKANTINAKFNVAPKPLPLKSKKSTSVSKPASRKNQRTK